MQIYLEQKRYIPNEGKDLRIDRHRLHGRNPKLINLGMQEQFEALFLLGIRKNDVGDGPAVQVTLTVENPVAPPASEGLFDGWIGVKGADLVVGVEDKASLVSEYLRDHALAAADATRDADDRFS